MKRLGELQGERYSSVLNAGKAALYVEPDTPRDVKTAEAFFAGARAEYEQPARPEQVPVQYLIDQG